MNIATVPTSTEIAGARLPATYEQAKVALASCAKIDECQEWANKAEALASYAKMADDDSLRQLADRIQARAVRRMGELLKQFDGRGNNQHDRCAPTKLTQKQAAEASGISNDQKVQAVRVANVAEETFDALVEGDNPPTVTALAQMGKQTRPIPDGFKQATHLIGAVKRFAEFCRDNVPEAVANGVLPSEVPELQAHVSVIDVWLDRFVVNLKGE